MVAKLTQWIPGPRTQVFRVSRAELDERCVVIADGVALIMTDPDEDDAGVALGDVVRVLPGGRVAAWGCLDSGAYDGLVV